MHICMNAGIGSDADAYIDMVARGKGTRISKAEKLAWNEEIPVHWQKCAWVDRPVMLQIAELFAEKVGERHGGAPVLLYADILDAHCHEPVLTKLKTKGNVFMCFVPPGCTDSTQAIDAGAGRSTRVYVGDKLDKWLEVDGNLEKWEKGLKAKERRILMTHWLAAAKKRLLENDSLWEGCFLCTGMLMKLKPNPDDEKIKPQGRKLPYNIPTESEAYPEVPEVRESASSIESCIDDSINDEAANSGNEIVVEEEENDFIHEIMAYLGMPVSDVNEEMYLAIEHVCNSRAV
mmetsp:Transcript_15468/g.27966  ORF Transcript_15468/g.27966 Transcript_15468/m.27966 type:complete len:290 (+) Transcript_15468:1230-2099(+)